MEWFMLIAAVGGGLILLLHGLTTLRGMKPKALYPLLRQRGKGGRTATVKVEG